MTSANYTAEISISLKSEKIAASIAAALSPDHSTMPGGSGARITSRGRSVNIRISTDDLASLRAGINSSLLLVDGSMRCLSL